MLDPDLDYRRQVLENYLRTVLRGDRSELLRRSGLSKGRISQMLKQGFGHQAGLSLAHELELDTYYFERTKIEEPKPQRGFPAQPVRPDLLALQVTKLTWEGLKAMPLPELFELVMEDDAIAPEVPRGLAAVFRSGLSPEPGDIVLVRDKAGRHYARVYRPRLDGSWEASALNEDYPSVDSLKHALEEPVAVMEYVQRTRGIPR